MSAYLINYPSPDKEARDMSVDQTFSFIFQGDAGTDYQIIIMRASDSTTLFTGTKTSLTMNNSDEVSFTVVGGTVSNGETLKYTIQTWSDTQTPTSPLKETLFYAYSDATNVLTVPTTITEQSYTFTSVWTQAEGLNAKRYQAFLYNENNVLIDSSEEFQSGSLTYTFDGFIDNTTYGVSIKAYDKYSRVFDSSIQQFEVDYSEPNINIAPSVTIDEDTSSLTIAWVEPIVINAVETGVITYSDDFISSGDKAINLPSGGNIEYTVNIPQDFTCYETRELPTGFVGVIVDLDDGGYTLGYDGTRFYANINGVYLSGLSTTITGKKWLIGIKPTEFYIREIV